MYCFCHFILDVHRISCFHYSWESLLALWVGGCHLSAHWGVDLLPVYVIGGDLPPVSLIQHYMQSCIFLCFRNYILNFVHIWYWISTYSLFMKYYFCYLKYIVRHCKSFNVLYCKIILNGELLLLLYIEHFCNIPCSTQLTHLVFSLYRNNASYIFIWYKFKIF